MIDFIIKHWKQISGVCTVIAFLSGWCSRLAGKIEEGVARQQQFDKTTIELTKKVTDLTSEVATLKAAITAHDKRLSIQEKVEELREKRLLK